jgi:hypothetical protein
VLDWDGIRTKNDPDHVEPKGVAGLLETRHPNLGGRLSSRCLRQLTALTGPPKSAEARVFISSNATVRVSPSGFGRNQVDVAVTIPEPALGNLPAVDGEPLLRHALSPHPHLFAEVLSWRPN